MKAITHHFQRLLEEQQHLEDDVNREAEEREEIHVVFLKGVDDVVGQPRYGVAQRLTLPYHGRNQDLDRSK